MTCIAVLQHQCPTDRFNGGDLRFNKLCGFADELYFVQNKSHSASGQAIQHPLPWKKLIQIGSLEAIARSSPLDERVWIARDLASLRTLSRLGITRLIYDGCDSQSLYFARRCRVLPWTSPKKKLNAAWQAVRWRRWEREISRAARTIIVPADADRRAFEDGRTLPASIKVISNGTDWIDEPAINRLPDARAIMFHGGFNWHVNRTTALYLASQVFPRIKARRPEAELRLAGNPVFAELAPFGQREGIYLEGHVDDLRTWLTGCAAYVMPMFQGGGVKNKLLEAMAAGLPIVTNQLGAEALDAEGQSRLIIANDDGAMVSAVLKLLEDREHADSLGQSAREYAVQNFGWQTLSDQYRAAVEVVAASAGIPAPQDRPPNWDDAEHRSRNQAARV